MKRIRIFIQFLFFLAYFQFLISMKFYFRFMLVFVSSFQGNEAESEMGEFLSKNNLSQPNDHTWSSRGVLYS